MGDISVMNESILDWSSTFGMFSTMNSFIYFYFFLKRVPRCPRLTSNLLCSPDQHWTHDCWLSLLIALITGICHYIWLIYKLNTEILTLQFEFCIVLVTHFLYINISHVLSKEEQCKFLLISISTYSLLKLNSTFLKTW